jgi:diamine N-acetyltransferase
VAQPSVCIVEVTADNIEEVLDVTPAPDQDRWVRPVAWYVARSAYEKVWHPAAVTAEEDGRTVVVGFAEWAYDPSDGTYCVGGVVVDARRQGSGYGRAAMTAMVALLRERPDCTVIALTVHEDNARARGLYSSLGYVATGVMDGDEVVMVLPAG